MRAILTLADTTREGETRLQTALAIARTTSGHVTLVISTPVNRYVAMDPFGGAYPMTEALNAMREQADALEAGLNARLSREDVPFTVIQCDSDAADALISASLYADIVLVSMNAPGDPLLIGGAGIIGTVAVAGSAPVLALPSGAAQQFDGNALIAWNDSAEAASAVRAALPLLRRAGTVQLLTVAGKSGRRCDVDAILRYLSRHDIHAERVDREVDLLTTEQVIEQTASELGTGWIVMGAYGHSRMRELLFGGVTRYMIDNARFPLFLAH